MKQLKPVIPFGVLPTGIASDFPVPEGLCTHAVQFYEDDRFLCTRVGEFVARALGNGQPAVLVATPEHRVMVLEELATREVDVETAQREGALVLLDARQTLAKFMLDGQPNAARFNEIVGAVLTRASNARAGATVCAYGEMVDVLWSDGRSAAAIALEQLWNGLARTHRFALLCGYAMNRFSREADAADFDRVCHVHADVLPAERYTSLSDDRARLREISALQQRATALQSEVARRRKSEDDLRQALADREAACRVKDEFLSVLSHELRTPLNAILGWTHIVTEPKIDQTTRARAIEVIKRNAQIQLHVIDDLLDVSRMMTGKLRLSTGAVDLAGVLRAAIDTARPAAVAKDIHLTLHHSGEGARAIIADRDRLQQVMWNLLSNAIRFTPAGGSVSVTLEHAPGHARIIVADTGQGIAADFLPFVFDRFQQADSGTTRKHGGLGLGLAVVRSLVEAHGGSVCGASAGEGLGSTFTVTLPARATTPESHIDAGSGGALAFHGTGMLVVDDDQDTRELFAFLLERSGATVHLASSAQEALDVLATRRCDLLLSDIGMPRQDGYTLIEAIRQHADPQVRALRAIAVTSYAGDHYRARAVAAGYDEYLTKPVEPKYLQEVISHLLRRHV